MIGVLNRDKPIFVLTVRWMWSKAGRQSKDDDENEESNWVKDERERNKNKKKRRKRRSSFLINTQHSDHAFYDTPTTNDDPRKIKGGLWRIGSLWGGGEREKSKGLSSWMKGWIVFTLDSFLPVPDQWSFSNAARHALDLHHPVHLLYFLPFERLWKEKATDCVFKRVGEQRGGKGC